MDKARMTRDAVIQAATRCIGFMRQPSISDETKYLFLKCLGGDLHNFAATGDHFIHGHPAFNDVASEPEQPIDTNEAILGLNGAG